MKLLSIFIITNICLLVKPIAMMATELPVDVGNIGNVHQSIDKNPQSDEIVLKSRPVEELYELGEIGANPMIDSYQGLSNLEGTVVDQKDGEYKTNRLSGALCNMQQVGDNPNNQILRNEPQSTELKLPVEKESILPAAKTEANNNELNDENKSDNPNIETARSTELKLHNTIELDPIESKPSDVKKTTLPIDKTEVIANTEQGKHNNVQFMSEPDWSYFDQVVMPEVKIESNVEKPLSWIELLKRHQDLGIVSDDSDYEGPESTKLHLCKEIRTQPVNFVLRLKELGKYCEVDVFANGENSFVLFFIKAKCCEFGLKYNNFVEDCLVIFGEKNVACTAKELFRYCIMKFLERMISLIDGVEECWFVHEYQEKRMSDIELLKDRVWNNTYWIAVRMKDDKEIRFKFDFRCIPVNFYDSPIEMIRQLWSLLVEIRKSVQ